MTKTRQDNDLTNRIGAIYDKDGIELLGLIGLGVTVTKTRQENDVTHRKGAVYAKNDTDLLGPIGPGAICDKNKIG